MESCFQDRVCFVSSFKISGLSEVYTGLPSVGKHYAIHLGSKQNKKQRKEEFFPSIFLPTCSSWIICLLILHWNSINHPDSPAFRLRLELHHQLFFLCPQLADRWKITALLSLHNHARQFLYIGIYIYIYIYIYAWLLYIYACIFHWFHVSGEL